jgi:hypothetical protein
MMKPMSLIVSDLERVITAFHLAESLDIDTSDLTDAVLQRLDIDGVTDAPALMKWIEDWVGRLGICWILKDLGVKFEPNEPPNKLLKKWFSHRGVGEHLQPQVRPYELTEILAEQAQQVAVAPAKLDGLRLMEAQFSSLMRYMSLFYWRELTRSGRLAKCGGVGGDDVDVVRMLEQLSLGELCDLLNCDAPLKAKPYDPSSKQTVTLSSGAASASLSRLAHLAGSGSSWSSDQSLELSDCLTAVLGEWHGEDPYTPKGCAVAGIVETDFKSQLTCHDELGGTVVLRGVNSVFSYGDNVLVRARDEGEVWASKPQIVPKGGLWKMPETGSRTGRNEMIDKKPERDQVFISYSHADRKWLAALKKHLAPYIRSTLLKVWDDHEITAGALWRENIRQALASARVAVLLVTPDFLGSDFIAAQELPPLLGAAESEGVIILWVPVKSSSFEVTPIEKYQAVHPPEKPLESLSPADRNKALVEICKEINRKYQR